MDLVALNKYSTHEDYEEDEDELIDITLVEQEEEEEEEELFEINLDMVNKIMYNYWPESNSLSDNSCYSSNYEREALLANCLLPISHLSGAIPIHYCSSYATISAKHDLLDHLTFQDIVRNYSSYIYR